MSQETVEEVFQVTQEPTVFVANIRGSIHVSPGETDEIKVTATKHGSEAQRERTAVAIWQDEDGQVHAETKGQGSGSRIFGFKSKPCQVDYVVRVPELCAVTLKGVSSSAEIEGLTGEVSVKTVSGPASARDLGGELMLETVSGKIDGESLTGSLMLKTVSGDANFRSSTFDSVQAKTVSGDVFLDTALTNGPYAFKSVSGDFKLEVPPETGGTLSMSSVSGKLDAGGRAIRSRHHHGPIAGRQVAHLADDGPDVVFHTVSGGLRVRASDGSHLVSETPEETVVPKPETDRIAILEQIAAGDLSVDDGLAALQQ